MPDRLRIFPRLRLERHAAFFAVLFLAILAFSLFFFLFAGSRWAKRVFFFAAEHSGRIESEVRLLPNHRNLEENAELFVSEVILGPTTQKAARLLPRNTKLLGIILQNQVLRVALSREALFSSDDLPLEGRAAFDLVTESILTNFPQIREVEIFVDGQVPLFRQASSEKKKNR